ncbi:hypothetical protein EJ06DRAFT_158107 [Trichodelitschia bisporula]|uniref:Uncharacterized protein n=1 Tax=Trichodelitschia bisporula TaxID=703511 RepID=A0A6G1HLU3_9PEZI|nr:hypothetical protein EJ06DRAFT_158107 [Trichodelitschia bisporula]
MPINSATSLPDCASNHLLSTYCQPTAGLLSLYISFRSGFLLYYHLHPQIAFTARSLLASASATIKPQPRPPANQRHHPQRLRPASPVHRRTFPARRTGLTGAKRHGLPLAAPGSPVSQPRHQLE